MIALSVSDDITYGFKPVVIPFGRVGDFTAKYNYSSGTFKGGHRSGENTQTLGNVVIYDFDDGALSLNETEDFLRDNAVSSILATSKSHGIEKNGKPACERFRLFIPLSRALKIQHEDYSAFYMFVAKILCIDEYIDVMCKDRSRFYFPNPKQEVRYIDTGYIFDTDILERNFQIYLEQNQPKPQKKQWQKAPVTSSSQMKRNEVPRDTQIELRGGVVKYLYEFDYLQGDETVPCRCINPTHEDRNPSAFVGRSKTGGGLQVTCKGCGYTAYMAKE